jgi:hypothetical protein
VDNGRNADVDDAEVPGGPEMDIEEEPYLEIFNHLVEDVALLYQPHEVESTTDIPARDDHTSPEGLYPASEEGEFIEPYPEPGAGAPIRRATNAEMRSLEPGKIGALADPENFELTDFLFTSLSAGRRDRFLKLKKVSQCSVTKCFVFDWNTPVQGEMEVTMEVEPHAGQGY